jgi:hypothetical protein
VDLATRRIEAFGTMELARRDGDFRLAAEAKNRLARLGVRVRYTREVRSVARRIEAESQAGGERGGGVVEKAGGGGA